MGAVPSHEGEFDPALFCTACFRRWRRRAAKNVCPECSGELVPISTNRGKRWGGKTAFQFSLAELGIVTSVVGIDLALILNSGIGAAIALLIITPATLRTLVYARWYQHCGVSLTITAVLRGLLETLYYLLIGYILAVTTAAVAFAVTESTVVGMGLAIWSALAFQTHHWPYSPAAV